MKKHKWNPIYSHWRHGGWYVDNISYKSGAIGCVSNNYEDNLWRIVSDERITFATRDAAARAEAAMVLALGGKVDDLEGDK